MRSVFSYASFLWLQLAQRLKGSDQPAFLCLLVICQAATILLTWQLWQVHRIPPMLAALPLPEVDTGIVLLISLAAILIRPLPGLIAHTVLVIYSILIDQMRLQPEIVSIVILMWGGLCSSSLKTIARTHLISLWFFAGLNKLLSPGYMANISFLVHPRSTSRVLLLPFVEIALGVLTLIPRSRKFAAALAFALHMSIFLHISPLRSGTASAVWFWNLALALAGFALIYPWNESLPSTLRESNPLTAVLAVLILVSPIGFYFGIVDAYLSHNLYSNNIPSAIWYQSGGRYVGINTKDTLNVPIPPEHRLFESYFDQSCSRGDYLEIHDPRYWAKLRGYELRRLECSR